MLVFRKRLIVWLVKAYFKKLGKRIFFFFIVGLIFFFLLRSSFGFLLSKVVVLNRKESIGIVGSYTQDLLPANIVNEISYGLTKISPDGRPLPGIAKNWSVKDNGKTYIFNLADNLYFSDGTRLTSDNINYNFSDARIKKTGKYQITYQLKDSYSPFLLSVSKPVFKDNFVGLGRYRVKDLKLNGNFVQSVSLINTKDKSSTKTYNFYSSSETLKMGFVLGEVSKMSGLPDLVFKETSFNLFSNALSGKKVNYKRLVTLFYNSSDAFLSDKKIRNALSYSLPDEFKGGKRAYSFLYPQSWAYSEQYAKIQNVGHAKELLAGSSASKSANLVLKMKALRKYKTAADEAAWEWKKMGIKTKIELVDNIPSKFQMFLGDFYVPNDPDQYTLWHSDQENNIANYKNLRIDKLLEDGRKTGDMNARRKIYLDLQKYLLDDSPASFLFFPYEYDVARK